MKREFLKTGDGSITIHLPDWNEQYHSKHGAVNEAVHVFIKSGLDYYIKKQNAKTISILEIGFGTGLNCMLTLQHSEKLDLSIKYTGVEGFPVSMEEIKQLNYPALINFSEELFHKLHLLEWDNFFTLSEKFSVEKQHKQFEDIDDNSAFDIIYFDAFGARVQPELWNESIFQRMYNALKNSGVLVTYAANGLAKRSMKSAGFTVEKIAGPPGKREMLRATK